MKLKTLLVSAVALLCSAASWAQDAGTYYIQNVSTEKWLGPGNSWGTQASALSHADYWKLAKISDGVYTLESVVSNGGTDYYLTGTFCDGSATNFTFSAVAGKANTYTIANGSGGLLTASGNIVNVSGSDASAEVSQWKLWSAADMSAGMAAATSENPFDATYLIKDHDLGRNNRDYSSWTNTNATVPKTANNSAHGNNKGVATDGDAIYSIEAYKKTFEVKQTLSSVPNGRYALRVNGFYRQDGSDTNLPYLFAGSTNVTLPERTGTENDMQAAAESFVAGDYLSDPATTLVTNNTLTIGVKTTGNSCWAIFKNFHLEYYGNAVSYYSPTAFTNNASATGETWYAFNIEYAGTYKVESSNTATIYYTQDDSDDAANTENAAIAATGFTTIGLTEGTLYFKSSATSTISITPLVLDGTYYLYNQRFDRFYSRGSWWGTRAVADIYGTPVILTTNATNSTTIKSVDNNGYIKETAWLYTDGNSGDATDFKILVSTVEGYEGYQFANNKLGGTNYLYVNATDLGNGSYGVAGNSIINENISDWNQTVWQLMSISDHNTKVDAYPTTNKTSVIEASGISTTAGDFETYLSSNYVSLDKSALINAISSNNAIGSGWSWHTTRNGNARTNAGYPSYDPSPYASLWKNTGYYTYTVSKSNLPAGIYKLEMQGFDRRQNRNSEATLYETYGNIGSSYFEANGQKVRIMNAEEMFAAHKAADPSWTIDREWAGQLSSLDGNYAPNTVYVYLDGNTDLDLTIEKPDYTNDACLVIGSISMTYYNLNTKTILENKGDITSLINGEFETDLEGWTGGKQVTGLARSWRSSSAVNNFMERTESGTMTCTLSNMPAGTYKVVAAARAAAGCKITPQIAGTSGATLTGVGDAQSAASEINMNGVQMPYSALGGFTTNELGHNWQWITATGTLAEDGDLVINFVTDASGKTGSGSWMPIDDVHLYCTHLNAPSTDYTESMSIITENIDVNNIGNSSVVTCDIVMSNPNAIISSSAAINGAAGTQINNNLVGGTIANMVLYDGNDYTSPAGEYAITNATYYRNFTRGRNATVMVPFTLDATTKADGTAYTPTRYANDVVLFTTVDDPAADVPYVFVPSSDITSLTGARASASEGSKQVDGTSVTFYGTYATTPIEQKKNNYVASNNMLWLVDNAQNSNPFRAYLHVGAPAGVKSLSIRLDDATGIQAVEGFQSQKTAIYNLAGQRLNKVQKGINIVNGKKVLVK